MGARPARFAPTPILADLGDQVYSNCVGIAVEFRAKNGQRRRPVPWKRRNRLRRDGTAVLSYTTAHMSHWRGRAAELRKGSTAQ